MEMVVALFILGLTFVLLWHPPKKDEPNEDWNRFETELRLLVTKGRNVELTYDSKIYGEQGTRYGYICIEEHNQKVALPQGWQPSEEDVIHIRNGGWIQPARIHLKNMHNGKTKGLVFSMGWGDFRIYGT
ncbi:hypothetical protein ACJQWY_00795 [Weissella kandleri]